MTARPKVLVVLPRGETFRNFVYSGSLERLAESASVGLLTVLPSRRVADEHLGGFDPVVELRDVPERWPVRILRELLDVAHGRWLWSEAARERWRLRDVEATTLAARVKRAGKKLACYPFASRAGLDALSAAERHVSRWLQPGDSYDRLLDEWRPDLVFNASHVHSGLALQPVQAAQWRGIPTATFIFSWDNLTSQGRILRPYDHYLVWNRQLKDQLLRIYPSVSPEQVTITGTPQFDFHFRPELSWSRAEFCSRVGADPGRPIVLYSTGMANHMPGEPDIVASIASMLGEMTDLGSPQLLVRVYPKDRTGRFDRIKNERPEVLFQAVPWEEAHLTPLPEDGPLLTNTLRHAAVGLNVASTVSLELCMFDRPVINVGFNPEGVPTSLVDYARYYRFDHYRTVVESGAVSVAGSADELRAMLRRALTNPGERSDARRALIASMFGDTLDGRSSDRVSSALLQLGLSAGAERSHR